MTDVVCSCHPTTDGYRDGLGAYDPHAYVTVRAGELGTTGVNVRSHEKWRALVLVRARIAAELRAFGHSLPEIGRAMNRDHSTIINLLRIAARTS